MVPQGLTWSRTLKQRNLGSLVHLLLYSRVADAHRAKFGPVGDPATGLSSKPTDRGEPTTSCITSSAHETNHHIHRRLTNNMKRNILITILLAAATNAFGQGTDYVIFKEGDFFSARNRISGSVEVKDKEAGVTIQTVLDKFKGRGGKVELMSGRYPLTSQLVIPSHVTISGNGTSTVVVIGKTSQLESAFYSDSTSKVTIQELAITSEDPKEEHSGIIFNSGGDCLVRDVFITGMGAYGIWYRGYCFLSEIRGCKISGSGKSGIFLQGVKTKSRAGDYLPNLIANCIIYGGNYGIKLQETLCTNIVACQVFMTKNAGIYLDRSNSTLISGCRTYQIQSDAVKVVKSDELNVSSNTFCWHEGHGIMLDGVIWGTINGNNFIDNGHINIVPEDVSSASYVMKIPDGINVLDSLKCGIFATNKTRGVTVSGNAVFNWGSNAPLKHGIHEDASCSDNIIIGNNINFYHYSGILSEGTNSKESNNLSTKEPFIGKDTAYQKMHWYDPRILQGFIEETRKPLDAK